ncbi:spinster family MFS transporter [Spirosoma flavum]|uniref:Spinster family MFS transporter n=1 Tax=Spirosoma flavum TaxID=2048557 RepID=A0ABW6AEL1_9BACT
MNHPYPSPRYAWYVVGVLMLAYISSYVDRQILSLLVEPLKHDFQLSDTEVGSLMGLSFVIFYATAGIPIGRLADRSSRRNIIALGVFFWSVMTALCGIATSYSQLFMFRVGVGVGEAALTAVAYSLLADYFPKRKLSTAMSVFGVAYAVGSGLAIIIGAALIQKLTQAPKYELPFVGAVFAWQSLFFYIGLPGILIAVLLLTVREPARQGIVLTKGIASIPATFGEVLRYIRANRQTFLAHHLGYALLMLLIYSYGAWIPSLFMRHYGWTTAQIGMQYSLIVIVCTSVGILVGGRLADMWRQKNVVDSNLRVMAWQSVALIPLSLFPLLPTPELALAALVPIYFCLGLSGGLGSAAIQEMTPNRFRATASAIYLFVNSLISIALGPLLPALLTDKIFADPTKLHYALVITGLLASAGAASLFWYGLRPYRATLDYLERYLAVPVDKVPVTEQG